MTLNARERRKPHQSAGAALEASATSPDRPASPLTPTRQRSDSPVGHVRLMTPKGTTHTVTPPDASAANTANTATRSAGTRGRNGLSRSPFTNSSPVLPVSPEGLGAAPAVSTSHARRIGAAPRVSPLSGEKAAQPSRTSSCSMLDIGSAGSKSSTRFKAMLGAGGDYRSSPRLDPFPAQRRGSITMLADEDFEFDAKRSKVVGRFLLSSVLGRGKYGKVRQGVDTKTCLRVAVKSVKCELVRKSGEEGMRRVHREVEALRRLRGTPHVVQLVDVIRLRRPKEKIYIAIQYMSGGTLEQRLRQLPGRRVEESTARVYFHSLLSAVIAAHARGIVHRDIKPENLMFGVRDTLALSDFGLAELVSPFDRNGTCNSFAGTVPFQPPEVAAGAASFSGYDADMWAVGVSLYSMVIGAMPFHGSSADAMLKNIADCQLRLPEWVSAPLHDLLQAMLTRDPELRPTAQEIMQHPWVTGAAFDDDTSFAAVIDAKYRAMIEGRHGDGGEDGGIDDCDHPPTQDQAAETVDNSGNTDGGDHDNDGRPSERATRDCSCPSRACTTPSGSVVQRHDSLPSPAKKTNLSCSDTFVPMVMRDIPRSRALSADSDESATMASSSDTGGNTSVLNSPRRGALYTGSSNSIDMDSVATAPAATTGGGGMGSTVGAANGAAGGGASATTTAAATTETAQAPSSVQWSSSMQNSDSSSTLLSLETPEPGTSFGGGSMGGGFSPPLRQSMLLVTPPRAPTSRPPAVAITTPEHGVSAAASSTDSGELPSVGTAASANGEGSVPPETPSPASRGLARSRPKPIITTSGAGGPSPRFGAPPHPRRAANNGNGNGNGGGSQSQVAGRHSSRIDTIATPRGLNASRHGSSTTNVLFQSRRGRGATPGTESAREVLASFAIDKANRAHFESLCEDVTRYLEEEDDSSDDSSGSGSEGSDDDVGVDTSTTTPGRGSPAISSGGGFSSGGIGLMRERRGTASLFPDVSRGRRFRPRSLSFAGPEDDGDLHSSTPNPLIRTIDGSLRGPARSPAAHRVAQRARAPSVGEAMSGGGAKYTTQHSGTTPSSRSASSNKQASSSTLSSASPSMSPTIRRIDEVDVESSSEGEESRGPNGTTTASREATIEATLHTGSRADTALTVDEQDKYHTTGGIIARKMTSTTDDDFETRGRALSESVVAAGGGEGDGKQQEGSEAAAAGGGGKDKGGKSGKKKDKCAIQ